MRYADRFWREIELKPAGLSQTESPGGRLRAMNIGPQNGNIPRMTHLK
jgi:hypothetical protein